MDAFWNHITLYFVSLRQNAMFIFPLFITFVVFSFAGFSPCFAFDQQYEKCLLPLRCGSGQQVFPIISYPFWGNDIGKPNFCGGKAEFKLSCKNNQILTLDIKNLTLRVISSNPENRTITVADESLFEGGCPKILNFTGDDQYFTINPTTDMIDLFDCSRGHPRSSLSMISCNLSNNSPITYHVFRPPSNPDLDCLKIGKIPILVSAKNDLQQSNDSNQGLKKALEQGFDLIYNVKNEICQVCTKSHGICGSESGSEKFQCLCEDKHHSSSCNINDDYGAGHSFKLKIGIMIACGVLVATLVAGGLFYVISRRRKTSKYRKPRNLEALIPLKYYSYAQVKRITKSFGEVVGKGGFGTVYRGTLCDGRSVAVKVLKESKGDGEDFVNEVSSMSKTSHVNIVDLLGFCSEGSKRAIIYEFLENGSLDKFISNKTSMEIDWMALYGIALGVARGVEYLHHGCKTRIVHFDIKPQNVLLDDKLCPKVSDFGLAKLCKKKESILSLLDTRGTIWYIAPEVFSRMYGRVTHKSDVYSYGMLVLEMIGARNKERDDQNSASNTSSMYFPEWIYKDLEKGDNVRLIENGISSEEEEVARKMTLVGLWCIQPSPSDRPAMNRVVEMMEGSVDAIEIPPRPGLQIPAAPLQESSMLSREHFE